MVFSFLRKSQRFATEKRRLAREMARQQGQFLIDRIADGFTMWIGSTTSILVHSLFFVGIFVLRIFGIATDAILLILTTIVSLEAIYLSIFIQRSVNKQAQAIEEVEEAIDETEARHHNITEASLDEVVAEIREDVKELLEEYRTKKTI